MRQHISAFVLMFSLLVCVGCNSLARLKPSIKLPNATSQAKPDADNQSPTSAAPLAGKERDIAVCLETARLATDRGMDDQAIANYLQVRKLDPNHSAVAYPLAVLYDRAGRVDAAEAEYQAALRNDPRQPDCLCDYGYFLYSTGRKEEAEAKLREALKLAPNHTQAQTNLALVLGSAGKYEEAKSLFTLAVGPAAAHHNIGMLKLRAGDRAGAIPDLQAAAARDPSLMETRVVLQSLERTASAGSVPR